MTLLPRTLYVEPSSRRTPPKDLVEILFFPWMEFRFDRREVLESLQGDRKDLGIVRVFGEDHQGSELGRRSAEIVETGRGAMSQFVQP